MDYMKSRASRKAMEARALAHIKKTFQREFHLMSEVLDFAEDALTAGRVTAVRQAEVDEGVVLGITALLTKTCKTLRAIRAVTSVGCGQDAAILLRALFESTLAIAYVLQKDTPARMARLLAHGAQRRLTHVLEGRKTAGLESIFTAQSEMDARADLDRWRGSFSEEDIENVRKHWAPGGIEGAAKALKEFGWHQGYNTLYRYTSAYAHVSDIEHHLILVPDRTPTIKLLPGDDEISRTATLASYFVVVALTLANEKLELGLDVSTLHRFATRAQGLVDGADEEIADGQDPPLKRGGEAT
jgi:hypothetical protein